MHDRHTPGRIFFADFELDLERRALCRDGVDLRLTPKEYQALVVLVGQAGKAVSRESLLAEVWPDVAVGDTSLSRCISCLRKHLGSAAIEAVPKFGYRFTLPVSTQSSGTMAEAKPVARPPVTGGSTPIARIASAAAVLLIMGGLLGIRLLGRQSATAASATWTDPQTNLTWTGTDNGADLTRDQAEFYCHNLTLAGHRDWRLPTIDELQTLYDTGVSIAGTWGPTRPVYWHVKGNLHLTGGETAGNLTWLTDLTPAGMEQSFDFSYGRRNFDAVTFGADHRALCTRPAKP